MGATLRDARIVEGEIEVSWTDGAVSRFSPFWLRDHCHAPESLHPDTLQRQVDTFAIPRDIAAESVALEEDGATLRVIWMHDGSASVLPAKFLKHIAETDGAEVAPRRTLWDRASLGEALPTVAYDEVMTSAAGLLR